MHIIFHVNLVDKVSIPEALQPHLHAYLAKICDNQDSSSLIVGGIHDHVHVLCRMSKNITSAKLLEELKTHSSKWIKRQSSEFGMMLSKFTWQKGYGIFSVSASQVDNVKEYILNQKEHHRKRSFKEEYILLLEKYNVKYNEKYLWSQ
jgi:REP element-mobilizing transposase RayT